MHFLHHFRVLAGHVGSLFDVTIQVVKHERNWKSVVHDLRVGFRPLDRQFEIASADSKRAIAAIVHNRLVKRPRPRFAGQCLEETLAVFGGILI